ncbi:upstream binding transcription factor, like isoform X2 [Festucalex cinctus]
MNGGGASAPQSGRLKIVTDEWRQEDCLTLLERIRSLLPDGDAMKYKTTESHFDWDKVGFGSFTGEMCRQKWSKVSTEVRKYRTMTELIMDAIEFVKNPYKGKKIKTHPDFPKKPLTPYFRFFMEKRAKYAKMYPEMSNLDLTKILSKKYRELPDKKKQKYVLDFQNEKEVFEKNLARFKHEHPDLMEERKKSDLPEKPKTPQQLWYNHEKKTYVKIHPEVSAKDLKEALRRQWSQLSDKRRLKWISKALELQKDYEDSMRAYLRAHPDVTWDEHVRSVLTKAERQLKDKFDGRPTKPPPNGYSLYCAELMVNMKDVRSTERMVVCSKRWKLMSQKEKDAFQKRCEQRKKQYDVDLHRFLQSLPEEERERVASEEKLGGARPPPAAAAAAAAAAAVSSPPGKEEEAELWAPRGGGRRNVKLPETPKTAEEVWQRSVAGDFLSKCRSDRRRARAAMVDAWKAMDKKEKIPWIKKAAEDQKRYEREMSQRRPGQKKPKFDGEPKKPPVSGYQMFSQELLTNGELNHFSLKERMVEIGKRWHTLTPGQKDAYKKHVDAAQARYRALLEAWLKDRAAYKDFSSSKRRSTSKAVGSPAHKVLVTAKGKAAASSKATPPTAGAAKRAMAYRAKRDDVASDSDDDKSNSSDSDNDDDDEEEEEEDDTSGSSDSEDDEVTFQLLIDSRHGDRETQQEAAMYK